MFSCDDKKERQRRLGFFNGARREMVLLEEPPRPSLDVHEIGIDVLIQITEDDQVNKAFDVRKLEKMDLLYHFDLFGTPSEL